MNDADYEAIVRPIQQSVRRRAGTGVTVWLRKEDGLLEAFRRPHSIILDLNDPASLDQSWSWAKEIERQRPPAPYEGSE